MSQKTRTLDKDKILSTPARRKLYQARLDGKNIREAAEIAGIGYGYARELCAGLFRPHLQFNTELGINALVKREQAKIARKTAKQLEITVERQLKEYERLRKRCCHKDTKDYTTAKGCLDSQSRIIGAFEADNIQRGGLTIADIFAVVQGRRHLSTNGTKLIDSTQVPEQQALTSGQNEQSVDADGQPQDVVGPGADSGPKKHAFSPGSEGGGAGVSESHED